MDEIKRELCGKKVLIVDDDPEFVDTLREQLESVDMRVVGEALTGADALKMSESLEPALIIMDILLPDEDGIETARRINEQEPRPILLLSGHANGKYIKEAKAAGIMTYLVKPVSLKELLPSIVLTMARFKEKMGDRAELEEVKEALANRKIIEQAKGLLQEKKGLTEKDAYNALRRKSQEQNKPLAEIARMLVTMQDLL